MKRRDLIRNGLLAGAASVLPVDAWANGRPARGEARRARNVIFYAYDGLTWEDVAIAQWYARRHLDRPLLLHRLLRSGRGSSMETYSLTSVVTDSSAASSAWSTGRKIVNGMMNVYPDETRLTTILELARAEGRATGLVTTTRITHATPAAWIAHVPNREMEDEIAEQYLAFRPDVLLGGGARHFVADRRDDDRDLLSEYERNGYTVVRTREALLGSNASRLLGVFHDDHMRFEIDRRFQNAGGPTLAEMTRKALDILADHEAGFVMQVEAGRIDHANHKNDVGASLWDTLAADEALAVLLSWVDAHPDTLLIMASDHGTGSGAAYGVGRFYRDASTALDRIRSHNASFDHMLATLGRTPTRTEIIDVVRAHTGVTLEPYQAQIAEHAIRDRVRAGNAVAFNDQPHNSLGFVIYGGGGARYTDRLNVNFVTGQHIAGPVPIAAYGRGAEQLATAFIDNTETFGWMCDALGIHHDNPVMTEEQARAMVTPGGATISHD